MNGILITDSLNLKTFDRSFITTMSTAFWFKNNFFIMYILNHMATILILLRELVVLTGTLISTQIFLFRQQALSTMCMLYRIVRSSEIILAYCNNCRNSGRFKCMGCRYGYYCNCQRCDGDWLDH